MCQFFSANSNGKGKTIFFKVEDIANEMAKGNPESYDWNSHTSIAHFHGIKAREEDKWNKWEYDVDKKVLKVDTLVGDDDRKKVQKAIEDYLKDKDVVYLRNLYNYNSGNGNSGYSNSGYSNSGNSNSGYYNSGNRNSGYRNSGYRNSGNRNSGNGNSGNYNSGYRNSGNGNSGSFIGHFCSKEKYFLFNKPCTKEQAEEIYSIDWYHFDLNLWVNESKMTAQEKKDNPTYKTTGGYLKTISYKEAWAKMPKEEIDKIKKLKNFDKKVFEEITGIK